jgi:hypothetical protein
MGKKGNVYRVLVGKSVEKDHLDDAETNTSILDNREWI